MRGTLIEHKQPPQRKQRTVTHWHSWTGQLWAVRNSIKPGDLVVMPMKTIKALAIGNVTSGYRYRDECAPIRHTSG